MCSGPFPDAYMLCRSLWCASVQSSLLTPAGLLGQTSWRRAALGVCWHCSYLSCTAQCLTEIPRVLLVPWGRPGHAEMCSYSPAVQPEWYLTTVIAVQVLCSCLVSVVGM